LRYIFSTPPNRVTVNSQPQRRNKQESTGKQ